MHDPWPKGLGADVTCHVRIRREQPRYQRVVLVPGPRVDDYARRLVDDEKIRILVEDREGNLGVRERRPFDIWRRSFERRGDLLARLHAPVPRRNDDTVEAHRTARDDRRYLASREAREQRKASVEALAVERARHRAKVRSSIPSIR